MPTKNARPEIEIKKQTWYFLHQKADEYGLPRSRVYGAAMEVGVENEDELDNRLAAEAGESDHE